MSVITLVCFILGMFFLAFSILFVILKENGAIIISGFNSIPKAKQQQYDKSKLVMDSKKHFFTLSLVSLAGAIFSNFFHIAFGILALIVMAVLFFRQVSFSAEKAFEKYKIDNYR